VLLHNAHQQIKILDTAGIVICSSRIRPRLFFFYFKVSYAKGVMIRLVGVRGPTDAHLECAESTVTRGQSKSQVSGSW